MKMCKKVEGLAREFCLDPGSEAGMTWLRAGCSARGRRACMRVYWNGHKKFVVLLKNKRVL